MEAREVTALELVIGHIDLVQQVTESKVTEFEGSYSNTARPAAFNSISPAYNPTSASAGSDIATRSQLSIDARSAASNP